MSACPGNMPGGNMPGETSSPPTSLKPTWFAVPALASSERAKSSLTRKVSGAATQPWITGGECIPKLMIRSDRCASAESFLIHPQRRRRQEREARHLHATFCNGHLAGRLSHRRPLLSSSTNAARLLPAGESEWGSRPWKGTGIRSRHRVADPSSRPKFCHSAGENFSSSL